MRKEVKYVVGFHDRKLENGKWSLNVFDDIRPFPFSELDDALEHLADRAFDKRPEFFEVTDELRNAQGRIKVEKRPA